MNETEIQFDCYQFIFSTKMKYLFEFNTAEYRDWFRNTISYVIKLYITIYFDESSVKARTQNESLLHFYYCYCKWIQGSVPIRQTKCRILYSFINRIKQIYNSRNLLLLIKWNSRIILGACFQNWFNKGVLRSQNILLLLASFTA